MHLVSRNWNKQGNRKWWLRAAQGGSCIKDEALQEGLTGWSPGKLGKLSANAMLSGICWKEKREKCIWLVELEQAGQPQVVWLRAARGGS